ncbi:MAG: glucuronate isomerase [Fidelibacterota bacterium]|nr:MAG: glucuronate isomerase [Candidatus Neomarinimicrobiota bacterium]
MSYLHPDRLFDPDPTVRDLARELYTSVKDLPLLCPHGHVDPKLFSLNEPFPNPTELILIPDHYIFRLLYSHGVRLEDFGVPARDGSQVETDHRRIWQLFGDHYYLFAGTPTGVWLDAEFAEVFGISEKLTAASAMGIYDQIAEKLQTEDYLPRSMFDGFNIEVLATTDAPFDTLEDHVSIRDSSWEGRVIPTFRPDAVTDLAHFEWHENIGKLGDVCGYEITSYATLIQALEERRVFFKSLGCTATDHGVESPLARRLPDSEAEVLFQRALKGKIEPEQARSFTAHMLMEMARMSTEDGLVMQIHPGAMRNHNRAVFERFGPDKGGDIPLKTEYTHNLHELLNTYGNDPNFRVIVFTLDETTYSRELAPLAGHYPAMRLGPPWWFNDSVQGMTVFRERITETAGFHNTVGFIDDTRAFPSIPARHDVSRRVDANFLAGQVARHIMDMGDALEIMHSLAYGLSKQAYNL